MARDFKSGQSFPASLSAGAAARGLFGSFGSARRAGDKKSTLERGVFLKRRVGKGITLPEKCVLKT